MFSSTAESTTDLLKTPLVTKRFRKGKHIDDENVAFTNSYPAQDTDFLHLTKIHKPLPVIRPIILVSGEKYSNNVKIGLKLF